MKSSVKLTGEQKVVARRVDRLRRLSFAEIAALAERQDETESVRAGKVSVATYRDRLADGRIRVMVQAYRHRFIGIGTMTADGFIIAADGTRTPVPEEMLWEFI